eukprot:GHVS01008240.1.p1 GENE.GHVS01008240.1~~GHVS01008240.1.p1  ORF type:complete len:224 (-),score=78.50 GHVS01008240.1:196-867(-)
MDWTAGRDEEGRRRNVDDRQHQPLLCATRTFWKSPPPPPPSPQTLPPPSSPSSTYTSSSSFSCSAHLRRHLPLFLFVSFFLFLASPAVADYQPPATPNYEQQGSHAAPPPPPTPTVVVAEQPAVVAIGEPTSVNSKATDGRGGGGGGVGHTVSAEEFDDYKRDFVEFDLNADGLIDAQELRAAFQQDKVEPAELYQFFMDVDSDSSGTVTETEYLEYAINFHS